MRIPIDFELRKLIFEIYDSTCYFCGIKYKKIKLDIHHLDKNAANNDVENLVLTCAECHMMQHPNNVGKMLDFNEKKGRI